jgi:hypothetical protein
MTITAPAAQKIKVRSRTYEAILELTVEHPMLTPQEVASLLGRNLQVVLTIMRSDAFLDLRAKGILERHGDKIKNVRSRVLDTADAILNAIQERVANPEKEIPLPHLVEAGRFLMEYITPKQDKPDAAMPGAASVNVFNISQDDVRRAQALQVRHANEINLKAQPLPALAGPEGRS